jgi:hypothetical protein
LLRRRATDKTKGSGAAEGVGPVFFGDDVEAGPELFESAGLINEFLVGL